MTTNNDALKAELTERLARHDWHYMMSDDYGVWCSGERALKEIERLVKLLGNDGRTMFEAAAPWNKNK